MPEKTCEKFVEGCSYTIPGVKCKWAKLQEVDRKFEPMWSVDIILNDKMAQDFMDVGYAVKKDKDGDWVLKCKRKETTRTGKVMDGPKVYDSEGNPFKDLVGNGSIIDVNIYSRYGEMMGKEYLTAYLNTVVVQDLVEFKQRDIAIPF